MTSVSGYSLIKAPCCGASHTTPQYASINLTAREYWSDGHKEAALYVEDGGLRKCLCGAFYLLRHASRPDEEPGPNTLPAQRLEPEDLPQAIRSTSKPIELWARRLYWRHLNQGYRAAYRARMDSVDQGGNRPGGRSGSRLRWTELVGRVLRLKKSEPPSALAEPVSLPAYEPSAIQITNMERLIELIQEGGHEVQTPDMAEVAELYRELGLFEQARGAMARASHDRTRLPMKLITDMITKEQRAPLRYSL
jgi:hypothetical protein